MYSYEYSLSVGAREPGTSYYCTTFTSSDDRSCLDENTGRCVCAVACVLLLLLYEYTHTYVSVSRIAVIRLGWVITLQDSYDVQMNLMAL